MLMWILLVLNLAWGSVAPDYRSDLDRVYNTTWAGRPSWAKNVPKEVRVYYADIPEHLGASLEKDSVDFKYDLPEFTKSKNRYFWIEDTRVFYLNEGVGESYKIKINHLLDFLLENNIKIHSELRGIPLTSKSTLKVFDPQKPSEYVFLKVYDHMKSVEISDVLNLYHKEGMGPDFYPEVEGRFVKIKGSKNEKSKKYYYTPLIKFRAASPKTSYEIQPSDMAIPLHAIISNSNLLEKIADTKGMSVNEWFLNVYSKELADFFYKIYYITGILPNAHSQNMVAIVSKNYEVKGFVWRDILDFHYNSALTLSHVGSSFLNYITKNVVNFYGHDARSFSKKTFFKKLEAIPWLRRFLLQEIKIDSFEMALAGYFGRLFDVLPSHERGEAFNKRIYFNFISRLASGTLDSKYETFIEQAAYLLNKNTDLVEFQIEISRQYNDMLMELLSEQIYKKNLKNHFIKKELVDVFVKAITENEVGFFIKRPENWGKWHRAEKHKKIAKDILNDPKYELFSDGLSLVMLKDTSINKWVAISHRKHQPTRLLEHVRSGEFENSLRLENKLIPMTCQMLFK